MTMLPHIANQVLDTPLVVGQAKLEVILAVIGPRIGIEAPASGMMIPNHEGRPAPAVKNGAGRRGGVGPYLLRPSRGAGHGRRYRPGGAPCCSTSTARDQRVTAVGLFEMPFSGVFEP